jgi:LPXTG-motif cell wall-anchored protein
MVTRIFLVTALIALLAMPVAVFAQEGDPVTVTENVVTSINEGDVPGAGAVVAPDATVTVPEATTGEEGAEAEPEAEAEYTGTEEVEAWLEAQAAAGTQIELGECTVAGETATCAASFSNAGLQGMGVGAVEGELMVTVVGGQIQSFNFTPSAEAMAMLQSAAMPAQLPATGGTQATTYLLLAVVGLLLLLAGTSVRAFRRSI